MHELIQRLRAEKQAAGAKIEKATAEARDIGYQRGRERALNDLSYEEFLSISQVIDDHETILFGSPSDQLKTGFPWLSGEVDSAAIEAHHRDDFARGFLRAVFDVWNEVRDEV